MGFRHAGSDTVKQNTQLVQNIKSVIAGFGILLFTLMTMGVDLILSTSLVVSQNDVALPSGFMDRLMFLAFNWTGSNGSWSVFIAWLFSISTTGLQYALWEGPHGGSRKPIRLLAWFIAGADTLTDMGGANVLLTGNPNAADDIFPPFVGGADSYILWFAVILLALICLLHEPALSMFLGLEQGKANSGLGSHWGAQAEASFIVLAGWLFSIVRIITVNIGAVGLLVFDFLLTPQNVSKTMPQGAFWGLSIFMFGLQMGVWRYLARLRHNGVTIKEAMAANDSGRTKYAPRVAVAVAILAIFIDTGFDTSGYNTSMYGQSAVIIDHPTLAWWLMILMVAVVCFANEPLTEELFGSGNLQSNMMSAVTQRGQALRQAFGGGPGGPTSTGGVTPSAPAPSPGPIAGMPGGPSGPPGGLPGMSSPAPGDGGPPQMPWNRPPGAL